MGRTGILLLVLGVLLATGILIWERPDRARDGPAQDQAEKGVVLTVAAQRPEASRTRALPHERERALAARPTRPQAISAPPPPPVWFADQRVQDIYDRLMRLRTDDWQLATRLIRALSFVGNSDARQALLTIFASGRLRDFTFAERAWAEALGRLLPDPHVHETVRGVLAEANAALNHRLAGSKALWKIALGSTAAEVEQNALHVLTTWNPPPSQIVEDSVFDALAHARAEELRDSAIDALERKSLSAYNLLLRTGDATSLSAVADHLLSLADGEYGASTAMKAPALGAVMSEEILTQLRARATGSIGAMSVYVLAASGMPAEKLQREQTTLTDALLRTLADVDGRHDEAARRFCKQAVTAMENMAKEGITNGRLRSYLEEELSTAPSVWMVERLQRALDAVRSVPQADD